MYKVEPQYRRPEHFETGNSMYVVTNLVQGMVQRMVSTATAMPNRPETFENDKDGVVNRLEQRQDRLFEQLEQLATKLKRIERSLQSQQIVLRRENADDTPNSTVPTAPVPVVSNLSGVPLDVVVTISPDRKPFALLAILGWLKHPGFNVTVARHVHSSVRLPANSLKELLVSEISKPEAHRFKCHLILTIIFKDTIEPQLIVSPTSHGAVTGEAQILRYLSSTFRPSLRHESDRIKATQVDCWLDAAQAFTDATESDALRDVLRKLDSHLAKNEYLVDDNCPSIADIGVLGALVNEASSSMADLPGNVKKWIASLRGGHSFVSQSLKRASIDFC